MKTKKIVLMIILILIALAIMFVSNVLFGNPISKGIAKKEVLSYFEDKYQEDFVIYSAKYNFLIPDYNITLGPVDHKEISFETSRYGLTKFDPYGAYF